MLENMCALSRSPFLMVAGIFLRRRRTGKCRGELKFIILKSQLAQGSIDFNYFSPFSGSVVPK